MADLDKSQAGQLKVGIIMGSDSDLYVMREAADVLEELGIDFEINIVSAHRTPDNMYQYAKSAAGRGISVIIAGAGGSAHLPGMVASLTCVPVIGVPIRTTSMNGLDSLLSIVQMPAGVPVATVPVNGGTVAGLLAARILGLREPEIHRKLIIQTESLGAEDDNKTCLKDGLKTGSRWYSVNENALQKDPIERVGMMDSKSIFKGRKAVLLTKHGKEEAIKDLFEGETGCELCHRIMF